MVRSRSRREIVRTSGAALAFGLAGCSGPGSSDRSPAEPAAPFSTLIATWRGHDPATTVTLQWLAPAAGRDESVPVTLQRADGSGDATARTDVTPFGDSDLHRHRADVSGLEPGTRYRVGIDDSEPEVAVRTAPEAVTEPVTFAAGGDVGTSSNVPPLHRQAASWDPLFAVVGGDLAYADGRDESRWITFLEHWHEYVRAGDRLVPLVAAIGNHEVRDGMDESPDAAPFFYTLFDNPHREHAYWTLDIGDALSIVILDSGHTADVAGDQTAWLEDALADRTDRDHLLAAYHVPIYPSVRPIDHRGREEMRERWVPLLDEYDVDVAFEHDDHAYKRTRPLEGGEPNPDDGVVYLGDGAWGQGTRDVHSPDERPYLEVSESERHVIRADLSPDGSRRFRAVDPDGTRLDQFASDASS
ncbi:purple acid phosphatase family protein [Halopiger goleimassiliensis]|uniref:purple acid phosphatase family protein n=1 Tax=Halopiger goleimassiliensis TaxID=1293048 RepID=UPI0006781DF0|nr:metallophosphoesterase family protein [Halopiger goleimassiliensis]